MNLISAGGIVYQKDSAAIYIAVCGRKDPKTFNLPKGTPEIGETTEETALREVNEETGIEVKTIRYIDSINSWVTNHLDYPGQKFCKEVYYYLMEPTGGEFSTHYSEFENRTDLNCNFIEVTLESVGFTKSVSIQIIVLDMSFGFFQFLKYP